MSRSTTLARRLFDRLEPVHAVTYFAPEARTALDALGFHGFWSGYFAARSAPLGPVPPEVVTAVFYNFAAHRVAKALPELKAKITGNSIRVPTPDVSIAILSLQLKKETTKDEVLTHLRETSLSGPLSRNLDYTAATDAVSSDFIGSRAASIIDANAAIVDGDQAILYCWYDNEFGYSCQVVRVLEEMAKVHPPVFPAV